MSQGAGLREAELALVTDGRYLADPAPVGDDYRANVLREDALLRLALERHGVSTRRVDWADTQVDWTGFRAILLRTPWDYCDRVAEFRHWVDQVSRQAPLWNPAEMVRWNLDKHYLADLSELGLPVVPSRFLEPGEGLSLIECITETGWEEGVVKPCVASAARLTYRVDRRSAAHVDDLLREARSREAFLFQPFLRDVIDAGEITLVAFDGRVTHAVRKRPRPGDFRVQDDHGGTVHPHTPTEEEVELAELTLAEAARSLQQPDLPLYGRVDLVRDSSGTPRIMELEWIEPELWLRMFPTAAQAFADGIAHRLDRRDPLRPSR